MFYLIIVLFVAGLAAISLSHRLPVDKASIALVTGSLIWLCIAICGETIYAASPSFYKYLQIRPDASVLEFVALHELSGHLSRIGELLFFLLGAMAIVEIIKSHGGFSLLLKFIKSKKKIRLLWIFSFITFFMSAVLDNLTIAIVMITLIWQLVSSKKTRIYFAGMIVIATSAGGTWSPIGSVTTLMLWIGGQVSASSIILQLFVPCLIFMLVPLVFLSLNMKGVVVPPYRIERSKSFVQATDCERWIILLSGMGGLILVPVFHSLTHLPPFLGILLVLGIMWIFLEIMHHKKQRDFRTRLTLSEILKKLDITTVFFLLGIFLAVAGLESAGHLHQFGFFLSEKVHNIFAINILIGTLSSVVGSVPLVAGMMGTYEVISPESMNFISDPAKMAYLRHFVTDGAFWELLAYCAGTGKSLLITGSAAGIVAMGLDKINFLWYLKKMSLLALAGYLSGITAYFLIVV